MSGLPHLYEHQKSLSRHRKPPKQQKNIKDKQTVVDKINRHNHKCENLSPQGITKNYVRFYESNFLPEPDSTKYNFQVIRNKFESRENSRQKTEKKSLVNKMPFNFAKLCKQFSTKSKLNKCVCQVEQTSNEFQSDLSKEGSKEIHKGSTEMKNNAKETFNNLLKEIIETVEKKKSERRILIGKTKPKSNKEVERYKKPKHIITKEVDSNRTDDSKCKSTYTLAKRMS
ncbi:hypothetical protein WDU94_000966 [Cyamophila willieti]